MINLAPWYYRKLLIENELIKEIKYFEINLLTQVHQFEAAVYLKENLVPSWVSTSEIYRNCEGSGTSTYKNISVYKAISEALERLAFFESVDSLDC